MHADAPPFSNTPKVSDPSAFAGVPNVLDTVIPFGLGVAEFALIALAVESIRWFLALVCLVCLMGVGAWARMWVLCRSGLPINRTSFVLFRPYIRFGIVSSARCGAAGLVLLVVSLQLADRHLWIATAASCLLVLWPLIRTAQIWNAPLRELRRPSSPDA